MTCPYCRTDVDGPEARCNSCGVTYHVDCWSEVGECAMPGCGGSESVDTTNESGLGVVVPLRPLSAAADAPRFCGHCGVPATGKFCGRCGAPHLAPATAEHPTAAPSASSNPMESTVRSQHLILVCGSCLKRGSVASDQRSFACDSCGTMAFSVRCAGCLRGYVASDQKATCPHCLTGLTRSEVGVLAFGEVVPLPGAVARRDSRPVIQSD